MPLENNQQDLQQANWSYNPTQNTPQAGNNQQDTAPTLQDIEDSVQDQGSTIISWTASEFIAYQKGVGWYVVALMALLVIGGIIFLITKDYISAIMTSLLIFVFIVFASRKPRVLNYEISDQGIHIGNNLINFSTLKSFAVIDEGSIRSIDLLPLKRFMPSISMYFEPQDELKIVQALGSYLPKEERNQPFIDKLMHKIRF